MLHRSLTYHLATISEDGIGHAQRIFETRFGWSVREIRVLRLIRSNPGITFTELARQTKFERSLTSRILAKLMKAGSFCAPTRRRMPVSSRSRPRMRGSPCVTRQTR